MRNKIKELTNIRDINKDDFLKQLRDDYAVNMKSLVRNHYTYIKEDFYNTFLKRSSDMIKNTHFTDDIFEFVDIEIAKTEGLRVELTSDFVRLMNMSLKAEAIISISYMFELIHELGDKSEFTQNNKEYNRWLPDRVLKIGHSRFRYIDSILRDESLYSCDKDTITERKTILSNMLNDIKSKYSEDNTSTIETYLVTSINHPLELVTQSLSTYFRSCHNCFNGEYAIGSVSMFDKHTRALNIYNLSSLKSWSKNEEGLFHYKIGRALVHLGDNVYLLNRLYPFESEGDSSKAESMIKALHSMINKVVYDSNGNNNKKLHFRKAIFANPEYQGYNDIFAREIDAIWVDKSNDYTSMYLFNKAITFDGLDQNQALMRDTEKANAEEFMCAVCGGTYGIGRLGKVKSVFYHGEYVYHAICSHCDN